MSSAQTIPRAAGERITQALGILAGRMAHLLQQFSTEPGGPIAQSQSFLWSCYQAAANGIPFECWTVSALGSASSTQPDPVDRLADIFQLSIPELDLLLFAGMPEEHEGYSAVFRSLHPRGDSRPSVGLAAQVFFPQSGGRALCRSLVENGTLFTQGILQLSGDGPFFDRSIQPAPGLWSALHEVDAWPREMRVLALTGPARGLERWLASPPARRAIEALAHREACLVAVTGDDPAGAFHRALALVTEGGMRALPFLASSHVDTQWFQLVQLHAVLRDAIPVLRWSSTDGSASQEDLAPMPALAPLVMAATTVPAQFTQSRAFLSVPAEALTVPDRRAAWAGLVPSLAGSEGQLASRYPLEPFRISQVACDLRVIEAVENRPAVLADVAQSLRSRAQGPLQAGVRVVHPHAVWEDLVLSPDLIAQLHEAVDRLLFQYIVLDDWRFLENRSGARGVRLLFSGAPGTGKTLSAEVLAHELDSELLVVDVSRVISKWVGETEKNLAAVFDAAESAQAVLLFDEADSLFAKRTEVSDAHDRYANLETAYLLQRLERFEGMAILATNFRQNIDAAFVRRLEFVLEFTEPDREQRFALWKRHIPTSAPADRNLNYRELAALYPVVGGVIRNAAVAAAFRAAADGMVLRREHFIHAIRREYEKAGKAFPGLPAGMNT